jgi:transcriptional regulator with XRE-family HTH domain
MASLGTQRSLAQKLGVEASHVAFIESGRRKPSLKLVGRIGDTLGLDRQEVLLLAHPEARALLSRTDSEPRSTPPPSWQRFTKNTALLARCYVTKGELQVLEHLSLLGRRFRPRNSSPSSRSFGISPNASSAFRATADQTKLCQAESRDFALALRGITLVM